MFTTSHEQRLAELRSDRDRAMAVARVACSIGWEDLKQAMVEEAREQQRYILRARRQADSLGKTPRSIKQHPWLAKPRRTKRARWAAWRVPLFYRPRSLRLG